MNGLPYYKRFPRDFIDGTAGMPFEEKTAYAFLLDLIYLHAGNLPDEPRFIAGQLGCSVRKWNAIRAALIGRGKIATRDGSIQNYRAIIELESLRKNQDQSKNAAKSRWEKEAEKSRQGNFNNDLGNTPASNSHVRSDMPDRCHTESDTDKEEEGAGARLDQDSAPMPDAAPLVAAVLDAVGLTRATAPRFWQGPAAAEHVGRWITVLGLTEAQIVAEARASRSKNPMPPDGPKALDRWMEQAAKARQSDLQAPQADAVRAAPKSPRERLEQFAGWINGSGYFPQNAASPQMCRALIDQKLVTPERLRERGLTF